MNFLRRLFGGSGKTPEPKPLSLSLKTPPATFSSPRVKPEPIVARGRRTITLASQLGSDEPHNIVGESHYQDALASIAGPKSEDGADEWISAELVPEPDNPYDPNAVAVLIEGMKVGHLSRQDAPVLLRLLKSAGAERAECDGTIEGGWRNSGSEGSYCVCLDIEWPPRLAG